MSCYIGFFNVRRGWQSLNTGPRFYLRLIRMTGWLWIYTSRTTDGRPFNPKKLSVPFLYPGVPAGLTSFKGLVPLGRRNLVPILSPAHPLGEGFYKLECILLHNTFLSATVFSFYMFTFLMLRKYKPQLTKNKQQNCIGIRAFDSRLYMSFNRNHFWWRYCSICG
jgi:hypothetical protein